MTKFLGNIGETIEAFRHGASLGSIIDSATMGTSDLDPELDQPLVETSPVINQETRQSLRQKIASHLPSGAIGSM